MHGDLPVVIGIFEQIRKVEVLALNLPKYVVVPLDTSVSIAAHRANIIRSAPCLHDASFAVFAEYLGAMICSLGHEV